MTFQGILLTFQKKMLENRPEDALVKLVKTVETDETVQTEDLKKYDLITDNLNCPEG